MRRVTQGAIEAAFLSTMARISQLQFLSPQILSALPDSVQFTISRNLEHPAIISDDGKNIVFVKKFDKAIRRAGWYSGKNRNIYDALFQSTMDHEIGHAYFKP